MPPPTNRQTTIVTPDGGVCDPGTVSPKLHSPAKLDSADKCNNVSGADTLGGLALGAITSNKGPRLAQLV